MHPPLSRPCASKVNPAPHSVDKEPAPEGPVSFTEEMDHVSTPIAPFYRSRRFSCICGPPFSRRARRSGRRGHSGQPIASSYKKALPGPFTARAALTGSRRELHAVGLLPGATAGFLTLRHGNQPMKTNPSPTRAYGRALNAFVLSHGWVAASCHRANPGLLGSISGYRAPVAMQRAATAGANGAFEAVVKFHSTRVFQSERVGG